MKKRSIIELIMSLILLVGAYIVSQKGALTVESLNVSTDQKLVIIDAGHGGRDPGKVGVNGEIEKDINLKIAQYLKELLEEQDIQVVMIRDSDTGLYDEDSKNKKVQDMQRRVDMIAQVSPDIVVSIHQNSYEDSSVCGPQVFYYPKSTEGKLLAEGIQERMNTLLEIARPRVIKSNDSYYILKKTVSPTVIIECGFLSNAGEANLLNTESYQKKVAKSVLGGILNYFNGK